MIDREPPIPEVFAALLAGLEEQHIAPTPSDPFYHCFGCGPGHPHGLRVRSFLSPDGGVVSPIVIARTYQGPPGAVHGGIVAAHLDEVLGAAAMRASGRPSVTGELTVRYVAPVPTEVPLVGRGRLVKDHGRYVDVEGTLSELESGRLLATARGRFFPIRR